MGKTREYSNGEVTIVWEAEKCIHSGVYVRGLPKVFKPKERPWITIDAASSEELVGTVKNCPSGALSYYMNDENNKESHTLETKVEVLENGPLLVYGTLKVTHKDGLKRPKIGQQHSADVVLRKINPIVMERIHQKILKVRFWNYLSIKTLKRNVTKSP